MRGLVSRKVGAALVCLLIVVLGAFFANWAVDVGAFWGTAAFVLVACAIGALAAGAYWWWDSRRAVMWRRSRLLRRRTDDVTYAATDRAWDNAFFADVEADELYEYKVDYTAEHVVRGVVDGMPVVAFDLRIEQQLRSRVHAVLATPVATANAPVLVEAGREDAFHFGESPVHFESLDFGRAFTVRASDARTAYDVVTPRVMQALLAARSEPRGRERSWMFSGGYLLTIDADARNTPRDFVHAPAVLRPVVEVLPRTVGITQEAVPDLGDMLLPPTYGHGNYKPRDVPFIRRWAVAIAFGVAYVVACATWAVVGSPTQAVSGTELWTFRAPSGGLVERAHPWGRACQPLRLVVTEQPPAERAAIETVVREANAIGLPVTVDFSDPRPWGGPTPDRPTVWIVAPDNAAPQSAARPLWNLFLSTRPSRANGVYLSGMEERWLTNAPEASGLDRAGVYRRLTRNAVAHGYGLAPRPSPAADSALRDRPEQAPDRWSAYDVSQLRIQSGCGRDPKL